MEQQLRVKTKPLPQRCDICHKSDLFDPQTGYCSRCNQIRIPDNQTPGNLLLNNSSEQDKNYYIDIVLSIILGFMFGGSVGGILGLLITNGNRVGFIIGGLIGWLISASLLAAAAKYDIYIESLKQCPFCMKKTNKRAIKCRACGSFLHQKD